MKKAFLALVSGLLLTGAVFAQQFEYHALDVACDAAPCPAGLVLGETAAQTVANGIGPGGDIVGYYFDAAGKQHGFLLSRGRFTTIDVADAIATSANGINPEGDIVGSYRISPNNAAESDYEHFCPLPKGNAACIKGFRYHRGHFTTLLFPGHPGAIPQRISPDGDVYGCLHDQDTGMSMFGAIWSRAGDFSLMTNGGELADNTLMEPMSMNNGATPDGHLVGGLFTANKHTHGFLVQDGVWSQYDVLDSISTSIWDMSPGGAFIGVYVDSAGHRFGFLQLPDGSDPIQVHYPDSVGTSAWGINPAGVIVGQYTMVVNGPAHGFYAIPLTN